VSTPIAAYDQLCGVSIAIEGKSTATGPSVADSPHHCLVAELVEAIASINQQGGIGLAGLYNCCGHHVPVNHCESLWWGSASSEFSHLPCISHRMDCTLNSSLEASAEFQIVACGCCLASSHGQYTLCHESAINLPNANGSYSGLFVKYDKSSSHEGTVGWPGWQFVHEPHCPAGHFLAEGF